MLQATLRCAVQQLAQTEIDLQLIPALGASTDAILLVSGRAG
jgi:hypothetical protein